MVQVYFSHLGQDVIKKIETNPENFDFSGELFKLIAIINEKYPGFKNCILDNNDKILSSVRIYKNIILDTDNRILDGEQTKELTDIKNNITHLDNVFFSSFDPKNIGHIIDHSTSLNFSPA